MDFQSYFFCSVDIIISYNSITRIGIFSELYEIWSICASLIKKSFIRSSLLMSLKLIKLRNILEVRSILSEDKQNILLIAFTFINKNNFSILEWLYLSEEQKSVEKYIPFLSHCCDCFPVRLTEE